MPCTFPQMENDKSCNISNKKKKFFDIIAEVLMWVCDMTHNLPEPYDEKLQTKVFIPLIGYHCPFATWAFQIDEKLGYNKWLVKK